MSQAEGQRSRSGWGSEGRPGAVSFTFDNLGEASDIEFGKWPVDRPIGSHMTVTQVVPELLDHHNDKRMIEFGIGLTDLVKRPTRGVEELKREEFAEGRIMLAQKLEQYAPQVVAFNGVGTFENFAQRPCKPGLQKERLYGAQVFVLPSTSAKNATGRGQKLRYFRQLAKVLEKLKK